MYLGHPRYILFSKSAKRKALKFDFEEPKPKTHVLEGRIWAEFVLVVVHLYFCICISHCTLVCIFTRGRQNALANRATVLLNAPNVFLKYFVAKSSFE